jgi:hypothetical protein
MVAELRRCSNSNSIAGNLAAITQTFTRSTSPSIMAVKFHSIIPDGKAWSMPKRIISDEKGGVLAWALVVLALGVLFIPPLLSRVSANLIASRTIEEGLREQYAADSGVEYALLQIRGGITTSQSPYTYTINNKGVEVTWGEYITETYRITSTATSDTYGSSTRIESYITLFMYDYLWLLDNAITSLGDIDLAPGTYVSGTVQYGGELDNKGTVEPPPGGAEDDLDENWPPAEDMAEFFLADVEGLTPYPDASIDIKDTNTIGPLYREGDLRVDNTGAPATLTLEGTIYVIGDLDFEQPGGSSSYTIDLNGQTIYVAKNENIEDTGDIYFASQHVSVTGSGCIIAEGFVNFQPGMDSSPDDFVFVMSVTDYVWMKPNGDFYGSLAGDAYVDLQPGCSLIWTDWEGRGLHYPDGTTGRAQIHTYKVYP